MLEEYIQNKRDDIIGYTCELIKFPSIATYQPENKEMPFGKACHDVLEYTLALGKKLGFRTKNIDGYCGYIEFGEGEELIGLVGHLDVVPATNDWTYSPFIPSMIDGKIYGRGAVDDKGPVIATLYAMKAVADTCHIKKRVRLILGLDEEKTWHCIKRYKKTEEIPSIGFSPDAEFPVIYAEKGNLTLTLNQVNHIDRDILITDIDCANNANNVVPKYCSVVLELSSNINVKEFIDKVHERLNDYHYDTIDVLMIDNAHVKLISHGTAAHASEPQLGKNAISPLLVILDDVFLFYKESFVLLDVFKKYIGTQLDGKDLGISCEDESGNLTLNVGNFQFVDDDIQITFNLRVPTSVSLDSIIDRFQQIANSQDELRLKILDRHEPLSIPKDSFLVSTLCGLYNEQMKTKEEPLAIGGGTYAKAFPNFVAFGPAFPGEENMCHQADEYITISHLITSSILYAKAIKKLAE